MPSTQVPERKKGPGESKGAHDRPADHGKEGHRNRKEHSGELGTSQPELRRQTVNEVCIPGSEVFRYYSTLLHEPCDNACTM